MATTVITADTLVRRYADDLAYVTQQTAATSLAGLIAQLDTAAPRYDQAGINGHEDLETAALHLEDARTTTDKTARTASLSRADSLLRPLVRDMTQEYRTAAGD
ncbi:MULTISPECIES: hypothetical protein [unclassified Streptomyces]|uniref:hypothetical protein n=1 Tax=unclassified Streptomyces TaxID=2593676 RepID=UPI00344EEBC2